MNINGKYLKDENGEVFSPVVGTNSIVDFSDAFGTQYFGSFLIWQYIAKTGTGTSTYTLSETITNLHDRYSELLLCAAYRGDSSSERILSSTVIPIDNINSLAGDDNGYHQCTYYDPINTIYSMCGLSLDSSGNILLQHKSTGYAVLYGKYMSSNY